MTILAEFVSNNGDLKYMKQKLIDLKGEKDNSIIVFEDFNILQRSSTVIIEFYIIIIINILFIYKYIKLKNNYLYYL